MAGLARSRHGEGAPQHPSALSIHRHDLPSELKRGRFDLVSPVGVVSATAQHDGFRQITTLDGGIRAQPLPFIAFAIFGGLLQAFIFITMSQMYLSMAVAGSK